MRRGWWFRGGGWSRCGKRETGADIHARVLSASASPQIDQKLARARVIRKPLQPFLEQRKCPFGFAGIRQDPRNALDFGTEKTASGAPGDGGQVGNGERGIYTWDPATRGLFKPSGGSP